MSVWVCCPSARPVDEVDARFDKWRRMGYKVALMRDEASASQSRPLPKHDYIELCGKYPGYAVACNTLIAHIFASDPECDWVVAAGDDMDPDANFRADDVAGQCSRYFGGINCPELGTTLSTFGVMQPTGDRWGEQDMHLGKRGSAYADRVCGSPWLGREFCRSINQGRGPFWAEYTHMFGDEALFEVASRLGILWQRHDLIHYHEHWARPRKSRTDMPAFLAEANSPEHWQRSKAVLEAQKAANFAGYIDLIP